MRTLQFYPWLFSSDWSIAVLENPSERQVDVNREMEALTRELIRYPVPAPVPSSTEIPNSAVASSTTTTSTKSSNTAKTLPKSSSVSAAAIGGAVGGAGVLVLAGLVYYICRRRRYGTIREIKDTYQPDMSYPSTYASVTNHRHLGPLDRYRNYTRKRTRAGSQLQDQNSSQIQVRPATTCPTVIAARSTWIRWRRLNPAVDSEALGRYLVDNNKHMKKFRLVTGLTCLRARTSSASAPSWRRPLPRVFKCRWHSGIVALLAVRRK